LKEENRRLLDQLQEIKQQLQIVQHLVLSTRRMMSAMQSPETARYPAPPQLSTRASLSALLLAAQQQQLLPDPQQQVALQHRQVHQELFQLQQSGNNVGGGLGCDGSSRRTDVWQSGRVCDTRN
jgi:hypothetical protein